MQSDLKLCPKTLASPEVNLIVLQVLNIAQRYIMDLWLFYPFMFSECTTKQRTAGFEFQELAGEWATNATKGLKNSEANVCTAQRMADCMSSRFTANGTQKLYKIDPSEMEKTKLYAHQLQDPHYDDHQNRGKVVQDC